MPADPSSDRRTQLRPGQIRKRKPGDGTSRRWVMESRPGSIVRLFASPPVIDSVTVPFPPDAAGTIADAYGSAVRGYFHRALGRRDLAEDLTQEVFVRVVRSADRYDARGRD